jgi:hypothetical protein
MFLAVVVKMVASVVRHHWKHAAGVCGGGQFFGSKFGFGQPDDYLPKAITILKHKPGCNFD